MKKNKYLKAKLTADTEEDCLYNTFWIYVAGISELLLIVMLQGELNYISIPCLIAAGFSLGVCAYVRFGKKAIADYCREKIGKEVRVIVKDDDPINEDGSISQNRSKPSRSRTVILEVISE